MTNGARPVVVKGWNAWEWWWWESNHMIMMMIVLLILLIVDDHDCHYDDFDDEGWV